MSDQIALTLDVSAVPAKPAGAGKYILELAKGLAYRDDAVIPTFISRRNDGARWRNLGEDVQVRAIAPKKRPFRLMWEQFRLPGVLDGIKKQLHHSPHYTLPERAEGPIVVTIHDMTFFDHPSWHEASKVRVFRRAIKKAAERADALIAVSRSTADRLQEYFGELPVTTIPLGVDHDTFKVAASLHDAVHDRSILKEWGVSGDFISFVGTIEPRKDVPTLLSAFDRIAGGHDGMQLVIAGGDGWGLAEVKATLAQMQHAHHVIRLGYVPAEVVPALFRQARAVAYPSLSEGFGLPALEALACGAPLVTARGSAMEEVVDGAALLIDAGNIDQLAQALDSLLKGERVEELRESGPQVATRYTWHACVDAHISLYKRVAG